MKLGIGIPIQDTIPGECFNNHVATIVEAVKAFVDVITLTPVGFSPHDYARHTVTEEAIKQGCDRLFFMDDDTITPRGGITALMETMDKTGAVAVSGFYLRRGNPYTSVWSIVKEDNQVFQVDADSGIHEIHFSGLGSCVLDLKWMEKNLKKPYYKMDQSENCTIISDDVVLFRAIRAAGGKILGNANVQCPHIGRREFIVRETAEGLRQVNLAMINSKFVYAVNQPKKEVANADSRS